MEDTELLRQYADQNSERAFCELVERHMDLVYSVALRQVHDADLANPDHPTTIRRAWTKRN